MVPYARAVRRMWMTAPVGLVVRGAEAGCCSTQSERLDHHQNDDRDHENGRHFIDNAIEFLRMAVAVSGKIACAAEEKAMQTGQHEDQGDFGLQPAGGVPVPLPGKPEAEHPT